MCDASVAVISKYCQIALLRDITVYAEILVLKLVRNDLYRSDVVSAVRVF